MAIRFEAVHGDLARFYTEAAPAPMAKFVAACVLQPDANDRRDVWIKGFSGRVNRALLRQLAAELDNRHVRDVLAMRVEGHVLPFGVTGADGITRISVSEARERWGWVDEQVG